MLIIDSLLKFKCFSLWRGAGEPLSFCEQLRADGEGLVDRAQGTWLRPVVGLIGAEHGEKGVQQFPHNCDDGLQTSFAAKH